MDIMQNGPKANVRFSVDDIIFEVEFLGKGQCQISYFSELLAVWIGWPGIFSTGDNLTNACRAMLPIIKGKTYLLGWVTVQPKTKGSCNEKRSKGDESGADPANAGAPENGGDGGAEQAAEGDRRRADADLCATKGIEVRDSMPEGIAATRKSSGSGSGNVDGGRV